MVEVDTNIILRYLTADHAELHEAAKELLSGEETFYVSTLVFGEIVYTLQSFYGYSRADTWNALQALFTSKFKLENSFELKLATDYFLTLHKLSFVDCYLKARLLQHQKPIATFDSELAESLRHTNDFYFHGEVDLSVNKTV